MLPGGKLQENKPGFYSTLLPGHVEAGLSCDSSAERWMWPLPFWVHFSPAATGGLGINKLFATPWSSQVFTNVPLLRPGLDSSRFVTIPGPPGQYSESSPPLFQTIFSWSSGRCVPADCESTLFVEFHISVICWFLTKENCNMELKKKICWFSPFSSADQTSVLFETGKKVPMKGKTPGNFQHHSCPERKRHEKYTISF